MKFYILLLTFLFSLPLLADSTFLSGLDFVSVYGSNENNQFDKIAKNGISVDAFLKQINSKTSTLGEKVALLEALSSYYEWQDHAKGNFEAFKNAYYKTVDSKNIKNVSYSNKMLKPETRLILQLMDDYDSTSPHVKIYQSLALEMPTSLTVQSISVKAMAYDILYNNKNEYQTIQDFQLNYLDPYLENYQKFDTDVPVEIKELGIDSILPYTLDCGDRLKCLVDDSSEQNVINGLNQLSADITKDITNDVKISNSYSSDWLSTKKDALEWINLQEKMINELKTSNLQKAEMKYFFMNKLYKLMHNIDELTYNFLQSSLKEKLIKNEKKCGSYALCSAKIYVDENRKAFENIGMTATRISTLEKVKNNYKASFSEISQDFYFVEAASADGSEVLNFENNFDTLHYLMLNYYLNPEKIVEMYDLD